MDHDAKRKGNRPDRTATAKHGPKLTGRGKKSVPGSGTARSKARLPRPSRGNAFMALN
jgi:hypothetical protein